MVIVYNRANLDHVVLIVLLVNVQIGLLQYVSHDAVTHDAVRRTAAPDYILTRD